MNSGIYKITSPNGRIYIGQSIHLDKRKIDYYKYNKLGFQIKLKASVNKYGWSKHSFDIIEECSIELLNQRERYWQEYYNSVEEGLNCKLTTTKDKSGLLCQETKDNISNALKGRVRTPKECENISKAMTGLKRPESGKAISKAHKERYKSKEERDKCAIKLRKAIFQYDLENNLLGKFASLREASRQLDIDTGSISKVCKGKQKQTKGFVFKYKHN